MLYILLEKQSIDIGKSSFLHKSVWSNIIIIYILYYYLWCNRNGKKVVFLTYLK